jgi:hypothetical protein
MMYELEIVRWNNDGGITTSKRTYTAEMLLLRIRDILEIKDLLKFEVTRHVR